MRNNWKIGTSGILTKKRDWNRKNWRYLLAERDKWLSSKRVHLKKVFVFRFTNMPQYYRRVMTQKYAFHCQNNWRLSYCSMTIHEKKNWNGNCFAIIHLINNRLMKAMLLKTLVPKRNANCYKRSKLSYTSLAKYNQGDPIKLYS